MHRLQKAEETMPPRIRSVSQWIWAIAALIGVTLLFFGALRALRMATCSAWPAVEGVIETSELQRGLMREGSLKYNYRIVYRYTVGTASYQCDRISFSGGNRSGQNTQAILQTYPKGNSVTVYHHPDRPGMAVLEVEKSWSGYIPLIQGILMTLLASAGLRRRWSLQTDYLFRERDPDAPLTWMQMTLGALGLLTCLAIAWIWWELIKQYAGR